MGKKIRIAIIKCLENDETKKLIGKIDTEFLKEEKIEVLYYMFPLIERMIIEIFKLVPESDVEYLEQGIMKTPISIVENNESYKVLPEYIIKIIKKYYEPDGVRNKLFHVGKNKISVNVSFKELIYLILNLLMILRHKLDEYNKFAFKEIELL